MRLSSILTRTAIVLLGGLYLLAGPVVLAGEDCGHDHGEEVEETHNEHEGHEYEEEAPKEHVDPDGGEEAHDDHEGHDHDEEAHEEYDDHAGHDHEDEGVIKVSEAGVEMVGIRVARVGREVIGGSVTLPGEVGFNEDRRVHVTPRYGGVIREMRRSLGAWVSKGDVLAVVESNESLTSYKVRSPLAGRIVAREGAVGAFASEETSLFVVADLSTVWVNLDVFPRHLSEVKRGARVRIHGVGLDQETEAAVTYVAPVFDRDRRAALARVVLSNRDGKWRPGMFVRAELQVATDEAVLAVERDAVQVLDDEQVVFIPVDEGEYRSVPVVTGSVGETHAEIVSGLHEGDAYVADGAFELKAKVVTSSLGGHAGHGH